MSYKLERKICVPCPACLKNKSNTHRETWRHGGGCNGTLHVDIKGFVRCTKCNKIAHITQMKYSCGNQKHNNTPIVVADFISAFCMSGTLKTSEDLDWVAKLTNNLL